MSLQRRPFFSRFWLSYRGWRQAGFGRGLAASAALSMATLPEPEPEKPRPHHVGRCIDGPCRGREISASAGTVYIPMFRTPGRITEAVYQWEPYWRGIGGWRSTEAAIIVAQERAS